MEMTGILFDAGAWLRGRAVLRGRYLNARDPRPELHTAKHESPWYGGPAVVRHARQELHIAAHIRRGDVGDARHFRYISTHRWSVALLGVAEAPNSSAEP